MAVGEKGMPGRRPTTSKPNTIHCCAQFGDLSGLKKCLEENPSLLNAKNDIMAQTPLHIAAGYNKVNIIKCLLEWNGPEKVELESKNMYGETPLHMAAKNGCKWNDAAPFISLACTASSRVSHSEDIVRIQCKLQHQGQRKTMVARVLGKLLHMVGILPTDKVTEVQRTDLVGEFVGHTGPKTRRKLQEAEGGILFVDEAYRLIPAQKSDDKDYGLEALEEIMSVMDNGKIVVVFAGYCEPMKRVITSNVGFCRRVTKFFNFDDFTPTELAQILHLKMNFQEQNCSLYGFKLHPLCTVEAVSDLICKGTTDIQRKEMNGGLIDPLLTNARGKLDFRLDFDCCDAEILVTITMEDLEEGLRTLSRLCDSSSMSSSTSVGLRTCKIYCDCNLSCNIYTSRKTDSYGRKFYRCPRNRTQLDCNFFKWLDEDDDATSSQSYEEKSMFEDFVKRMLSDVKLQYRVLIEFHVVLIIILLMLVMLVWSIYLKM